MKPKLIGCVIALSVLGAGHAGAIEWEVWLSDQANSADISAENPTGTFGSRMVVYEGRDLAMAPPGTYGEGDGSFGPTVIQAHHVFPTRSPSSARTSSDCTACCRIRRTAT
ncbi:MAG: hypothetical protein OXQ31_23390 [Spirochaetaceae bacterium]|nr:hypothetical protein [Spirochaetaceae bacterium]